VGAIRAVAGELEHARAQCGEHERHGLGRRRRPVDGQVVGVQVFAHRGHRSAVVVPAQLHSGRVAHTEPEHEAPVEPLGERVCRRVGGRGIACIDAGDAGRDRDPPRRGQQDRGVDERLLVHRRLAEPERRISELLDLGGGIALDGG
jgi:hypothetical protein